MQFGSLAATLALQSGFKFNGLVVANSAVNDVLQLAGTVAATLNGLGTQFTGFSTLTEAAGANWTLTAGDQFSGALTVGGTLTLSAGVAIGSPLIADNGSILGVTGAYSQGSFSGNGGAALALVAGSHSTISGSGSGFVQGGNGGGSYDRVGGVGGAGISLVGAGSIANAIAILGGSGGSGSQTNAGAGGVGVGVGVSLSGGGSLVNTGRITGGGGGGSVYGFGGAGGAGAYLNGGTLTNTGTITGGGGGKGSGGYLGAAGDAVQFASSMGRLVVDPGAVFSGQVVGNSAVADVLELAGSTAGTLAGFGTQFTGLSNVTLDTGAIWTIRTSVATATATKFTGLALADTLDLTGGGTLTSALSSPGTLQLDGTTGFVLTASSGLHEASVLIDAGAQLSGTGSLTSVLVDSGSLLSSSATTTLKGAVTGAGTLSAASGSTLSVAGGLNFAGQLAGAGTILLASVGTLTVGASLAAGTILQENNLLLGSGESVTNAAGHTFDLLASTGTRTITLSAGSGDTLANAGTLSATGPGTGDFSAILVNTGLVTDTAGTFSLLGAVTNSATMSAAGGTLLISHDVAGTGALTIGATSTLWLQAGSAATQTADFLSSSSGALDLSAPSTFLGHIAGFAGADTIDLIASAATTLTFSGSTLTVLNGTTKVASLMFNGSYTLADFHLASDGSGGSVITFI